MDRYLLKSPPTTADHQCSRCSSTLPHQGRRLPFELPYRRVPLQKRREIPLDVAGRYPGHLVPDQLHRQGEVAALLSDQRGEGVTQVVTGEASQTGPSHQVPNQFSDTFVTALLVSPTFAPEYLLVVGQAVSQAGQQLSRLGEGPGPIRPAACRGTTSDRR